VEEFDDRVELAVVFDTHAIADISCSSHKIYSVFDYEFGVIASVNARNVFVINGCKGK
jgi:hypothetical protein